MDWEHLQSLYMALYAPILFIQHGNIDISIRFDGGCLHSIGAVIRNLSHKSKEHVKVSDTAFHNNLHHYAALDQIAHNYDIDLCVKDSNSS